MPDNPPAMNDRLLAYFAERERERATAVDRVLDKLTDRETRLLREAAVMGYVLGATASGSTRIPPDSETVAMVVDGCIGLPDLYPVIAGLAEGDPDA